MKSGQTLAHFEIIRPLGKGGMGEVYLARDTKLKREVAIKVLPESVRQDPDRLKRFRREAEAAAKLKHNNIATIHALEDIDDQTFIVMEYVEGKPLTDHIPTGGMELDTFFDIFIPLADALAHAHGQGRIHRDLKPGNIVVAEDGTPKILDFGLARIIDPESTQAIYESDTAQEINSQAPTMTMRAGDQNIPSLTHGGQLMGTPMYMSPEQAEREESDHRTDIFSFGVIMYEALTGMRPYQGKTLESIIGKIIEVEPKSVTEIRPVTPYTLWVAIRRCLKKKRGQRTQTAEELHSELQEVQKEVQAGTVLVDVSTVTAKTVPLWRQPLAIVVLLITLAAISVWAFQMGRQGDSVAPPRVTLTMTPPPGIQINANWGLAVSPDEQSVVFFDSRSRRLFLRDLSRPEAVPIPGTESSWKPFFSPDGTWLAFFDDTQNTLKRVRLDGLDLQTLTPVPPTNRSGGWDASGTIVFNSNGLGGLSLIAENGGDAHPVARDAGSVSWLDLLPGAEVVVGGQLVDGEHQVVTVHLETGETKVLFPGVSPRYVSTGHLLYGRGDEIWAVPFDPERLEMSGSPMLIVQGVGGNADRSIFDVTENLLVYSPVSSRGMGLLPTWVDRQGNRESLDIEPGRYAFPRISPDGNKVALVRSEQGNDDIVVFDLESEAPIRLTFHPATDWGPVWTTDGERLVFSSARGGSMNLYSRSVDGTGGVVRLTRSPADQQVYGWAADGSLLFTQEGDIWSMEIEPIAEPVRLTREAYAESYPTLAPDGGFIAFQSEELGYPEIFVHSFPDLRGKWLVSTLDIAPFSGLTNADLRDGRSPVWSPTGEEILYRSGLALVRVPVNGVSPFAPGAPEVLFEGNWPLPTNGPHYDVSRGDGRFLMLESVPGERNELIVVQNWIKEFEGLE